MQNHNLRFSPKIKIIISIIAILLFIISIVLLSFSKKEEPLIFESKINLRIDNVESFNKHNIIPIEQDTIINSLNIFFSTVYPEIEIITINDDSLEYDNNHISFSLSSNKNNIFYFFKNEVKTSISNSNQQQVFEAPTENLIPKKISPLLINEYLPYIGILSDGTYFDSILEDNLIININIKSCVSEDLENEAIHLTKKYIENINSDPSFFTYKIAKICS